MEENKTEQTHSHEHHTHSEHTEIHHEHSNKKSFFTLVEEREDLKYTFWGIILFLAGVIMMMMFPRVANPQTGGMLVSLGIPAMLIGIGFFVYGVVLFVISVVKKKIKAN